MRESERNEMNPRKKGLGEGGICVLVFVGLLMTDKSDRKKQTANGK